MSWKMVTHKSSPHLLDLTFYWHLSTFFLNRFLSQVIWPCSFPIIDCNDNFRGEYKVLMCSEEECHKMSILYFSSLSSRHSDKVWHYGVVIVHMCLLALSCRDSSWSVASPLTSPLCSCLCS